MGIINVTPDSFSDGSQLGKSSGEHFVVDLDKVLQKAGQMVGQGAVILDVGGESTRPGAATVSSQEELDRVLPVLSALRSRFDICLSVDTSTPEVIQAAISEGVEIVNDVRALGRQGALEAVVKSDVAICLMHMRGQPRTMQETIAYEDVVGEVLEYLRERVRVCELQGIAKQRLIVDPGFGFGKTVEHNYLLLKHLHRITELQLPVLIGVSRKSMIGAATGRPLNERLAGSIAATSYALSGGANIIRTHDVAATMDAIRVHSFYSNA